MEELLTIELTREEARLLVGRYENSLERDANLGNETDDKEFVVLRKLLEAIKK